MTPALCPEYGNASKVTVRCRQDAGNAGGRWRLGAAAGGLSGLQSGRALKSLGGCCWSQKMMPYIVRDTAREGRRRGV